MQLRTGLDGVLDQKAAVVPHRSGSSCAMSSNPQQSNTVTSLRYVDLVMSDADSKTWKILRKRQPVAM